MAEVAYIRVSTVEQKTDRQLAGQDFDKVFEEKVSGSLKDRPELKKCLRYLREGDVLHVHSLDRLARNVMHLLELVEKLTKRGVSIRFHKEGWLFGADAKASDKLMLQIFAAVAEFERAMMLERQAEGIAAAKAKGVHMGRARLCEEKRDKVIKLLAKEPRKKVVAALAGVAVGTVYNIAREIENERIAEND